ncbi:Phage tail assembly chaperone protein [Propionispira arboris]|uniref:Phage tail assembly chaperone protein n=1 Tax=Propionispira arboris TaxID=84035 RepID=A0A1H7A3V2_9FIRM|nr:phage tail assembly chaperone [Propionispira arboris]SEJ60379.1 Phage tail assembly chaperone protein [Propionispira arboris]
MKYLAKFDASGNRITSIVKGIHFETDEEKQKYIDSGFIEISDEDQELYATNEYIQGTDGKPQKKSPYVPTVEEKLMLIRKKRDKLLVDSDWTDTLSAKTRLGDAKYNEWQVYRQALRDITNCADLDNPIWPIKPV